MSEKTSVLLSDVTIKGDIIEKERLVIDAKIDVRETHDVADVIENADVLYVTRVQKERFTDSVQTLYSIPASSQKGTVG